MIEKIRVLWLATNPSDLAYVRAGDEFRETEARAAMGPLANRLEYTVKPALRASDLGMVMLKHTPHIVHFAGHGLPDQGIVLDGDSESPVMLGVDELSAVLRAVKANLRLIVFNVCHSRAFAEATAEECEYAMGMDGTIEDKAAITFAAVFYQTLAFGLSVRDAFNIAKNLAATPAPILAIHKDVDASQPFLGRWQESEELKQLVRHLAHGTASEEERLALRRNVIDGKVLLEEIDNAQTSEGDRVEGIEVRPKDSLLQICLGRAAYKRVKERLFPSPPGIPPPFAQPVFIGRESAVADVQRLLGDSAGPAGHGTTTVIRGWPGVGKTSLVSAIGRDPLIIGMFPDGVLWMSLEQKPNLISEMASWGRALGTEEILKAPTLKEASALLAALLLNRRMLLIVDDVWDSGHAAPFFEVLGAGSALLITTRLSAVAEKLTSDEHRIYVLPVLTEESSMDLLRILVPLIVAQHQDECRELVGDLEYLPLALHVAGNLLRTEAKMGWGVVDLIEEIRAGAKLLPEPAPLDRAEGNALPTVKALLMKSTDVLDSFTRDCFAFLGAFAPKPATFDIKAMQAVWEVDDAKSVVRTLVGHGLLEPIGDGRFQMHKILVDHAISLGDQ